MTEHIYVDSDMEHERYHVIPFGSMREEIVRCRDCKFYDPKDGAMLSCKYEYRGYVQWKLVEPDGFCAWACRKDEQVRAGSTDTRERRLEAFARDLYGLLDYGDDTWCARWCPHSGCGECVFDITARELGFQDE